MGRHASVQAKRELYFRKSCLKMKEESFDGNINKERPLMLLSFTNI